MNNAVYFPPRLAADAAALVAEAFAEPRITYGCEVVYAARRGKR